MLPNGLLNARFLALSVSFTLGSTYVARADEPRDPYQPIAISAAPGQAQAGPGNANPADARVEVARVTAESAKGKVAEISARLDEARKQANDIRNRMLGGESVLRDMQGKAEMAAGRLQARRQELAAEGVRYAPLRDAFEQARLDAIRDFNSSPQYRLAVEAVSHAANKLRSLQTATGGQASEADVKAAQADLQAAKSALDALRQRFMEQDLPRLPKVAAAEQPLKIEQERCDALSAAITSAEQDVAETQAALKQQTDGLARDRVALGELTADISRCEAELPGAQADANKANDELSRAIAVANASHQPPVAAQPTVVYRYTSPYVTYPPGVVYAQSGTVYVQNGVVYAPGAYYGNYVIAARPYIYGAGGVRYYSRVYGGHGGHR